MDKYKYVYEDTSDYCYSNTDILINKLNINDDNDLYLAEQELVGLRIKEIVLTPVKGNFDFRHLKNIHKFLFQDVFDWAGIPRTCNITKTNLFCLAQYIDSYAKDVFDKLARNHYYLDLEYTDKLKSLAELFADINALHPFRDGNGRTQREFISGLAKVNGINLDFKLVEGTEMIIASSESTKGDITKLLLLFNRIANSIPSDEQLKYIDQYILDTEIRERLKNNI